MIEETGSVELVVVDGRLEPSITKNSLLVRILEVMQEFRAGQLLELTTAAFGVTLLAGTLISGGGLRLPARETGVAERRYWC